MGDRVYPLACLYFSIVQNLNLLEHISDHFTLGVSLAVVVQYRERFEESSGKILKGVHVITSLVCIFNGSGYPGYALVGLPNSFVVSSKDFHSQAPILLPVKYLDPCPSLAVKAAGLEFSVHGHPVCII